MSVLLEFSSWSVVVVVVCALAMGVVFDRIDLGRKQRLALGAVAGIFGIVAFASMEAAGAPMAASGVALVLMTGLFAGSLATLVAIAPPFALSVELGGAGVLGIGALGACLSLVAAAVLGSGIRVLLRRHQRAINRRTVAAISLGASFVLAVPLAMDSGPLMPAYPALLACLALTSALFGLLIISEQARAGAGREERQQASLLKETRQVSAEMLETQLRHHWQLHGRYGVQFGFMIAAVDDGPALRRALSPAQWQELRIQIARLVREAVREGDICGPLNAARTGILLPYIGPSAMERVASRIRDAIANAEFSYDLPISLSVGMAHVDEVNGPGDLRVIAENALLVARVATPRGAIGPRHPSADGPAPLIRSFPGVLLSPASHVRDSSDDCRPTEQQNNVIDRHAA